MNQQERYLMKWMIAGLITIYQTYFSRYKKFYCAHRLLHGGASCSEAIREIVLSKGIYAGFADIRERFRSCREAASVLSLQRTIHPRGDLDCSFGVCDSCGDFVGVDGGSGGGDSGSTISLNWPFITLSCGAVLLVVLFSAYWFYGRQVSAIDIRLLDAAMETRDGRLARLFRGQLPDYQIILEVAGREIKTNTLRDVSARDWISLKPRVSLYATDIDRLTITNKQLLKDQALEAFHDPADRGEGEYFEFIIREKWDLL
jgi:putative component of membrane protein insertase Oxa1/YidC/SpoIIIJ protein YidD